jgi:hypothetical protein
MLPRTSAAASSIWTAKIRSPGTCSSTPKSGSPRKKCQVSKRIPPFGRSAPRTIVQALARSGIAVMGMNSRCTCAPKPAARSHTAPNGPATSSIGTSLAA